jgi:carboxymethylenebutenolidase
MEITTTTVRLRAADGEMRCHQAQPRARGRLPAVLVIMEAFGLHDHIKDVTERIAQEGYVAIAPDLYYRFSPNLVAYDQLEAALALAHKLDPDRALDDLRRVVAHLRAQNFVDGERLGIIGFGWGGALAFLAACQLPGDFKAAVLFYGGIAAAAPTAPLSAAGDLQAPILCLFGANDPSISPAHVERIEATLRSLGKTFDLKVYPGADHGFFCDERASYQAEAAQDAWERTLAWFARYLRGEG